MNTHQAGYRQIVHALASAIERGDLLPGDEVGPISVLVERYGVSASTVKRALSILADRGLVEGERGRGVFVARHRT